MKPSGVGLWPESFLFIKVYRPRAGGEEEKKKFYLYSIQPSYPGIILYIRSSTIIVAGLVKGHGVNLPLSLCGYIQYSTCAALVFILREWQNDLSLRIGLNESRVDLGELRFAASAKIHAGVGSHKL